MALNLFFFFVFFLLGRYSAGYDLAARRKNATRESTATLKSWLNEHKKNPYPTKGEKIMLAIITKMTLTQVSTWFANARRRLKKENKMTWEPKNKTDDDDDDDAASSDCDGKDCKDDMLMGGEKLKDIRKGDNEADDFFFFFCRRSRTLPFLHSKRTEERIGFVFFFFFSRRHHFSSSVEIRLFGPRRHLIGADSKPLCAAEKKP